jgi:uncharacterized membrane protein YedE/YeeE
MTMMVASLACGLLFGVGLILAGMADPAKVLGFLDIAGHWDPSLAMVMLGAIATALVPFALVRRRDRSVLGRPMRLPTDQTIDRRLVLGSVVFGIGWGLAGICPGPALVLMGAAAAKGWIFGGAMLAGVGIFEVLDR